MRITLRAIILSAALLAAASAVFAQNDSSTKEESEYPEHVRSSPAFAELILRRAVLEAELEELLVRYTNDFPKVSEMRYELAEIETAIGKLLEVPAEKASKLTLALGKMLVQRAEYATELDVLKRKYEDSHPEVKRAAKKLEIFDKAVRTIL
ncbi:MAG: hypothetical protein IPM63_17065 [Acidobacteriota bacterium]|nr:MAG: hypothetical protein IPM63_17065 [Acidobacteriota bacterium]